MMAMARAKKGRDEKARGDHERKNEQLKVAAKQAAVKIAAEKDEVESEEDEGGEAPVYGMVNLETGRCTKGRAISSPLQRSNEKPKSNPK
jgi:hypothetical protein